MKELILAGDGICAVLMLIVLYFAETGQTHRLPFFRNDKD